MTEMTPEQKQEKYCEMMQLLTQNDYIARKVVFEVAEKLKELHPEIQMPEYEKYRATEEKAREFRKIIDDLDM